ncbi:hypothetical protein [Terribacillus saccharophilus]|nr:hypothetical protein [Terribacillus saccharophilus]
MVTTFFIAVNEFSGLSKYNEWITFDRFWNGFSEMDLENFRQSGTFKIPYLWLILNIIFFLSLRAFLTSDLTSSGGAIIIRTGIQKFVLSKMISLFVYTASFIMLPLLLVCCISLYQFSIFHVNQSIITDWKLSLIYCFFLIISLFVQALFFEVISIVLGEILAFIIVFGISFMSMFNGSVLLISNYTMFSRWKESLVFIDNVFALFLWLVVLLLLLIKIEMLIVKKMDFINEKGEK